MSDITGGLTCTSDVQRAAIAADGGELGSSRVRTLPASTPPHAQRDVYRFAGGTVHAQASRNLPNETDK